MLQVLMIFSIFMIAAGAHAQGTAASSSASLKRSNANPSSSMNSSSTPMSLRTSIKTENEDRLSGKWSLFIEADHNRSDLADQRTRSVFGVAFDLKYELTDYLYVHAVPSAFSENGHIQSESATTGSTNAFAVREATVNLHYQEAATLSLGALNHTGTVSELLIANKLAFPGARTGVQIGEQKSSFAGLFVEGAIPTSSSLTSNTREFEKTPSFALAGVQAQYKARGFTATPRLNYFAFSGLPSSVAQSSGLLGNSIDTPIASTDSRFIYDYRGLEGGGKLRNVFTRVFAGEIEGSATQNQKAPSGFNRAYAGTAKVEFITGKFIWSPSATYFRVEPDAAVSYYNDSDYQTNRVGYSAALAVQFRKVFKMKVSGGERSVIYESASQGREKFMSLSLETLDAIF